MNMNRRPSRRKRLKNCIREMLRKNEVEQYEGEDLEQRTRGRLQSQHPTALPAEIEKRLARIMKVGFQPTTDIVHQPPIERGKRKRSEPLRRKVV